MNPLDRSGRPPLRSVKQDTVLGQSALGQASDLYPRFHVAQNRLPPEWTLPERPNRLDEVFLLPVTAQYRPSMMHQSLMRPLLRICCQIWTRSNSSSGKEFSFFRSTPINPLSDIFSPRTLVRRVRQRVSEGTTQDHPDDQGARGKRQICPAGNSLPSDSGRTFTTVKKSQCLRLEDPVQELGEPLDRASLRSLGGGSGWTPVRRPLGGHRRS
jgi:hypothetical protein